MTVTIKLAQCQTKLNSNVMTLLIPLFEFQALRVHINALKILSGQFKKLHVYWQNMQCILLKSFLRCQHVSPSHTNQTKTCLTGLETADRYQIQQQTVPEHGMLYPALNMPPLPSRKHAQVLTSCSSKRAKPEKNMFRLLSFIFLSLMN